MGDFFIRHDNPSLDGEFADHFVIIGINVGNNVRPIVFQALDFGEVILIAE